jgi:hypothetical protein
LGIGENMTREYQTLLGDGRAIVDVEYDICGERDDFDIDVVAIKYCKVDILECLIHDQILELEAEIHKHHEKLMSGQADI